MKVRTSLAFFFTGFLLCLVTQAQSPKPQVHPKMYFSDISRIGKPFAKDPSVIKFKGSYWMYYSIPASTPASPGDGPGGTGWGIGVARSSDLIHWKKVGEVQPVEEIEKAGIAAPGARVIDGKVHLFYQTYGKGKLDSICHAVSSDAAHFKHDPSNPIYRPADAKWSAGRAIDAEVYPHGKELWLFFATRDPEMQVQQIGLASAPLTSDFSRGKWHTVSLDGPTLKPEVPWEGKCVEAPSVMKHGGLYYLFYAGNYNNAPQQIGVATSKDGKIWTRIRDHPLLRNGAPGTWNSSESGHPGVFTDDNGKTYLFYQGNDDGGKTWFVSMLEIRWHGEEPYLVAP